MQNQQKDRCGEKRSSEKKGGVEEIKKGANEYRDAVAGAGLTNKPDALFKNEKSKREETQGNLRRGRTIKGYTSKNLGSDRIDLENLKKKRRKGGETLGIRCVVLGAIEKAGKKNRYQDKV